MLQRMFCFRKRYLLLTIILFMVEVAIAIFINDSFVRPYVGDFLVVMLVYCFLRSFINASVIKLAFSALLIACLVEAAQYFHAVDRLGLQHNPFARTVIGSSFEWSDVLAYTLGTLALLAVEKLIGGFVD